MPASTKSPAKEAFVVCLNPSFPEANSWWDPVTGTNLFLDNPFSGDLSEVPESKRTALYKAIDAGLLIVAEGDLPEGYDRSKINQISAGRVRVATVKFDADVYPKELEAQTKLVARLKDAVEHHALVTQTSAGA